MSRPRVLQGIALFTFALVAVAGVLTAFHPAQTSAAASSTVNFQARLEAANGAIVPDGNYNVEFKLYDAASSGTLLWTEDHLNSTSTDVHVVNGYLTVNLGSVTAFGSLNWNQQLWLTMNVGNTNLTCTPFSTCAPDGEMSPRMQLTALPYAFQAGALGNGTNQVVLDSSGNLQFQQASIVKELSAASGTALTLQGGAATGAGNNGGNLLLQGGAGGSGAVSGSVIVKPAGADTTSAFQVQNAAGAATLLNADTTNLKVTVNGNIANLFSSTPGLVQMSTTATAATNPMWVAVQGKYAYVIEQGGTATLQVFDITNVSSPVSVGTLTLNATTPNQIQVQGGYAYIAEQGTSNAGKLEIVDISNPHSPISVAALSTGTNPGPFGVYVSGSYAYVADSGTNDMAIVNISNPAAPRIVSTITTNISPRKVYVQGRYAYVVSSTATSKLQVIDVSNPAAPSIVGSLTLNQGGMGVSVQGRYAYITEWTSNGQIEVADVSNPAAPTSVYVTPGSVDAESWGNILSGRYLFTDSASDGTAGLGVIDVASPSAPSLLQTYTTGLTDPRGIFADGRYLFLTDKGAGKLIILDTSGLETTAATIHSLEAGTLNVDTNANVANNLSVGGGVTVGQGGIFSAGGISAYGPSVFGNSVDSTTALQVQNSTSDSILTVGTTTSNLISNSTFEANTAGWAATGTGASVTRNTTQPNSFNGTGSLQVTTGTSANSGAQVSAFTSTLAPGSYTLSFYAKASSSFTDLAAVFTGGSVTCTLNSNSVSNSGFQRYTCSFTSTTTNITAITIGESGTTSHVFYLDAVQLVSGSSLTPYQNGNIQINGVVNSAVVLQSAADSTSSFAVLNSTGTSVLTVDSMNARIGIGTATPGASLDLAGGTIQGAGLSSDCSGSGQKLLWSSSTKQFICGTDRASYTAYKAADQSVSSTTLTDATNMTFPVGANETWIFYFNAAMFDSNKASSSYLFNVTSPTGSTCNYSTFGNNASAVSSDAKDACNQSGGVLWGGSVNAVGDAFTLTGIVTTDATHSGNVTMQFARNTGTATITQYANVSYVVAYKVTGADLAEVYYSQDPSIQSGDVVAVDPGMSAGVRKTTTEYESDSLGIISTHPGQVLGAGDGSGMPELLALSGRVPVKVSSVNGTIEPGDYLTTSNIPGVAMKATRPGQVIGKAMTAYNDADPSTTGMVIAFANLTWADPGAGVQGTDSFSGLNVSGITTLTGLTVTGPATFLGNLEIDGHIITGGNTPTAVLGTATNNTGAVCTLSGNDTSGTINLQTGSTVANGEQCVIDYTQPFSSTPRSLISPDNEDSVSVGAYVSATPNDLTLYFSQTPRPSHTYMFNYWNPQ